MVLICDVWSEHEQTVKGEKLRVLKVKLHFDVFVYLCRFTKPINVSAK